MILRFRQTSPFLPIAEASLEREGWEDDPVTPEEVIEDYLDRLYAPWVGVMPYRERSYLREEAGFHIERLANGYTLEGKTPLEAARLAVTRYGASQEVGERFLSTWLETRPQGYLARRIGPANLRALTFFGAATLLTTLLLQTRVFRPDPSPLTFGLSPAQMRHIVPEPLPLPDASITALLLVVVAILAPIVAGILTGICVPSRPERAVYHAQLPLTLYMFLVGVQMLPLREGIWMAITQLCWWIPAGCLSAHLAAMVAWRWRLRTTWPKDLRFANGNGLKGRR